MRKMENTKRTFEKVPNLKELVLKSLESKKELQKAIQEDNVDFKKFAKSKGFKIVLPL